MRERAIETALVRAVRGLDGLAIKLGGVAHRGLPDRLALLPGGRALFVELKAPGRKPTPLQARTHERLRALGFRVDVIDSPEDVQTWAAAL